MEDRLKCQIRPLVKYRKQTTTTINVPGVSFITT